MSHYKNWNEFLTEYFDHKVGGVGIHRRGTFTKDNKYHAILVKFDQTADDCPQFVSECRTQYFITVPKSEALNYVDRFTEQFHIVLDAQYRPVTKVIERREKVNAYTSRIVKVNKIVNEPCATHLGLFSWADMIDNDDDTVTLYAEAV